MNWVKPTRGDLIAGISVAFILVPQSLAYAEIAGLPAFIGLYAAALPPIAAAFFASSRYLQTGPVAMTSLLTFGALAPLATPGSDEYIALAILLALIVGVVRAALGWVGAGTVAYLMSQPVLLGFTSAAAILIIASQLPTALGVVNDEGGLLRSAAAAIGDFGAWDWTGIVLAIATGAIILGGRRIHRVFPGVLIAVIAGIAFSTLIDYTGLTVGDVPTGLPPFSLSYPWSSAVDLLIPGIVIALIGFAEPAAIARTFAAQDRERWDPDQEFVGQGLANIASSISGGFPVGGSFSRSSVNRLSGARTRWSGAVTGLTVLAFLPIASVLASLPRAILAAIVITGVFRLVRVVRMARMINQSWGQSAAAWGTFVATLALAPRIDLGVIVGILLGTALHLRREMKIRVNAHFVDDVLTLQPSGVLFFGSAPRLDETLVDQLAAHPEATEVVVSLEGLGRIDYTGAFALKQFTDDVIAAGLDVSVQDVPAHAEGIINRTWGDALPRVAWD